MMGSRTSKILIAIHKDDPNIIQERRQALATMIKLKTEESRRGPTVNR